MTKLKTDTPLPILRGWQRRALTLQLKAGTLLSDVIMRSGLEDAPVDAVDNAVSYLEDLGDVLNRMIELKKGSS